MGDSNVNYNMNDKMSYAPIALFTYNRAEHTKQAVESLLKNREAKDSDLFIFSDGPKNEKAKRGVEENRAYIKTLKDGNVNGNFRSVTIIEREKNWGLANSLIAGITEIVNKYGRVIVVEDDLILSPYFLKFMNDALEKYKDDERVSTICSFTNPVKEELPETFFLRYFACWGWATWKRGWDLLEQDSRKLLWKLRNTWKVDEFNIDNSYNFYNMLYGQMLGEIDSWAIRYYASSFVNDKLMLYPGRSLCAQMGIDGSGTHAGSVNNMQVEMTTIPINIPDSIKVEEHKEAYEIYSHFYRSQWGFHTPYNIFKYFIRRLIAIDFWQHK